MLNLILILDITAVGKNVIYWSKSRTASSQ